MSRARAPSLVVLLSATLVRAQGYVDRVLEDGPQPQLKSAESIETGGWPRGWKVEFTGARGSGTGSGIDRSQAFSGGLGLSGYIDTPNYGSLSASANLSAAGDAHRATLWRLDQVAMPLEGGWRASHSVGSIASPSLPLRGVGRIGLAPNVMEGASGVYELGDEMRWIAALGRPGSYSGLGVSGFNPAPGQLVFLGGQRQWRSSDALGGGLNAFAAQYAAARNVADPGTRDVAGSSDSLWASWRWLGRLGGPATGLARTSASGTRLRDGEVEAQASMLASRFEAANGNTDSHGPASALGWWADAAWRSGALEQTAGVFNLPPGLRWGSFPAIGDLRGAYWRGDWSDRQLQVASHVEWAGSVSGQAADSAFTNVTVRWRADTRNTLAAAVAVRRIGSPSDSVQLSWDGMNPLGQTQWRLDVLRSEQRRARRISIDHNFEAGSMGAAGVSLFAERAAQGGFSSGQIGWGVFGGARPWNDTSVDLNLRGVHGAQGSHLLIGNLTAAWTPRPRWTLLAQFTVSEGQQPQSPVVESVLATAGTVRTPTSQYRRVQLTLRYEDRAGSVIAPAGGKPGSGSGSVSGFVYFDQNGNERRDAAEAGVGEVTIRLDGRYTARTDPQGRYEFPMVAPGSHLIEVVQDNVPLPWGLRDASPRKVSIELRGASTVDFGLIRNP